MVGIFPDLLLNIFQVAFIYFFILKKKKSYPHSYLVEYSLPTFCGRPKWRTPCLQNPMKLYETTHNSLEMGHSMDFYKNEMSLPHNQISHSSYKCSHWLGGRERERESNLMDWCSVSLTASVIPLVFTHSIFTNRESLIKNNYHKYFISFVIFRKSKKKKTKQKKQLLFQRERGSEGERKKKKELKTLFFSFLFFLLSFIWLVNL